MAKSKKSRKSVSAENKKSSKGAGKTSFGTNNSKRKNAKPQNWKSLPVDESYFSQKEFENLVSFEVLEDYQVLSEKKNGGDVIAGGISKQSAKELKAAKRRKSLQTDDSEDVLDEDAADVPMEANGNPVAKKAKLTKKTKGTNKSKDAEALTNKKTALSKKKKGKKLLTRVQTLEPENEGDEDIEPEDTPPVDMKAWAELGVPPLVMRALSEKGFDTPTSIQALTLPSSILGKKDIVGAAETGSGKTLAFAIPIIHGIMKIKEEYGYDAYVKALILTPTRELAVQIKDHINDVAKHTGITTIIVMGGLASQKQERLLAKCPDIIVATPGRLWELVNEGNPYLETLSRVRYLAIDETDRMVERGHFQELEGILGAVNSDEEAVAKRQNFIFSATLSFTHEPPERMKHGKHGPKNQQKKVSSKDKLRGIMTLVGIKENPKIVDITSSKGTSEKLTEMQITCDLREKDYYLYYFFVRHPGRTIVFCNSINCVRRLTNLFFLLKCSPLPLHSEMTQKGRLRSLEQFSADDNGVLIATDVAARGLDIVDIEHVIHYQVPKTAESYIHRSGRTARAFKGGIAVTLKDPGEMSLFQNIMRSLQREEDLPEFVVDNEVYREIKERVNMAVKVEQFEHTVRKKFADINWMEKARKELDLASSDDDSSDDDLSQRSSKGKKKNMDLAKKELERCKGELDRLLSVNLFTRRKQGDVRTTLKKMSKVSAK